MPREYPISDCCPKNNTHSTKPKSDNPMTKKEKQELALYKQESIDDNGAFLSEDKALIILGIIRIHVYELKQIKSPPIKNAAI